VILLEEVGFSFGAAPILKDVNLHIRQGELVGLIGPSGAGKTTLLRLILKELHPSSGMIRTLRGLKLSVGYVPQLEAGERSFPITVEEMVMLGGAANNDRKPWFNRAEKAQARDILGRLQIHDLGQRRLNELSGGQFQRALIARALMSEPNLLILDEPTSGIDLQTRSEVLALVRELVGDGLTVVLTTHDLNWVASQLPRIVCLNKTVIAEGTPIDVLTPEVVRRTYNADMDVVLHNGRPVVVDHVIGGA
jgi:zinc/manganese transport system ATP-binding protein